jgi:hypothetical protein
MKDECCVDFSCAEGKVTVCVVPKKDMGKEIITALGPDGKEKSFKETDDLLEYLRKKTGLSREDRRLALEFVSNRLRSLTEQSDDVSVNVGTLGFKKGKTTKV